MDSSELDSELFYLLFTTEYTAAHRCKTLPDHVFAVQHTITVNMGSHAEFVQCKLMCYLV